MTGFQLGYWLSVKDKWIEVTKAQYVAAERAAGFFNTMGQPDEPATSAFLGADGSMGSTLGPGRNKKS